jgi:HK97 family phage portal protein
VAIAGRNAFALDHVLSTCIMRIADAASSVPLIIYKRGTDGNDEPQEDGELYKLLNWVNPFDTGYGFRRATHIEYQLMGNALWVMRGPGTKPNEMQLIKPDNMTVRTNDENQITGYELSAGGKQHKFEPEDIIHFRSYNPFKDYVGIAPTEIMVNPVLMQYYIERWNINFFKTGATVPGALITDQKLDADYAKLLKEDYIKKHGGVDKAWEPLILQQGLKYEKLGSDLKDMGFEILFRVAREGKLAVFGVPPVVYGDIEHANYANAKAQKRQFWELTIIPYLRLFESVINEIMIPRFWPNDKLYVKHDLSVVEELQEDQLQRAQVAQIYVSRGIKTVNEERTDLGLEPVEWGDEPPSPAPSPFGLGADEPMFRSLKEITDPAKEKRLALWKAFDEKATMRESGIRNLMRDFFVEQGREIRKAFDAEAELTAPKPIFRMSAAVGQHQPLVREPLQPIDINAILAVLMRFMQEYQLQQLTETTIAEILAKAGAEALTGVGVNVAFDIANPAVKEWIERKALTAVTTIHQTSHDALKKMLVEGVESGMAPQEISKNIGQLFDGFRDYRSDRIARTETVSAHNRGSMDGWRQSDVVEGKEWLTAPGADSPRHELMTDLDGQRVLLDEPFIVDGFPMQFPGDPGGPAEHIINCRCTHVAVLKKEGE